MNNIFKALKKNLFFLLIIASNFAFSQNYFDKKIPDGKILVVAHRADWRNYPENSIKAIESSIKMGVDIVEVDLQKTKDGKLIIMHDKTLDRTTTLKGKVSETNFIDIQKAFLKNGAGMKTREKIPTLEELLTFIKGKRIMVNLDKAWDYFDDVVAMLKKTDTENQIILKGNKSAQELKKEFGSKLDHLIYMPMVWPEDYSIYERKDVVKPETYVSDFAKIYNPVAYEVIIKDDNKSADELLNLIKNKKSLIWINALWAELCAGHDDDLAIDNPDEHWGWAIRKGATIIQTDRPKELIEYLKSINKKYEN